ncbi:MAG: A24 family peptidase [Maritimibacter sp.]
MFAPVTFEALWYLPFTVPLAIWVAYSDMSRMKIPNRAVMATFLVFVVMGFLVLPFQEYLWRYTHMLVALAVGFVLNLARLMGAGDAKFIAAFAPFIALRDLGNFAYIFAAVLIIGFVMHRSARRIPAIRGLAPQWESWDRKDFPMGLCLAGALIVYQVLTLTLLA